MQSKKSVRKQTQKRTALAGWLYLIVLLTAALFFRCSSSSQNSRLYVLTASSMNQVMTEVLDGAAYPNVLVNSSSSGTLARQIAAGAPCDLYLSANRKWIDFLLAESLIDSSAIEIIAQNSLVLIVKSDDSTVGDDGDWKETLINSNLIAIGDPAHVPAGIYAAQAMKYYGIDSIVKPKLIEGKDVVTALRLVQMGEADCGFVYQTDALSAKGVQIIAEIDAVSHAPINYYRVSLSEKAKHFLADPNVMRRFNSILQAKGFL